MWTVEGFSEQPVLCFSRDKCELEGNLLASSAAAGRAGLLTLVFAFLCQSGLVAVKARREPH